MGLFKLMPVLDCTVVMMESTGPVRAEKYGQGVCRGQEDAHNKPNFEARSRSDRIFGDGQYLPMTIAQKTKLVIPFARTGIIGPDQQAGGFAPGGDAEAQPRPGRVSRALSPAQGEDVAGTRSSIFAALLL